MTSPAYRRSAAATTQYQPEVETLCIHDVCVVSETPEKAAEHFGWFAMFAAMGVPTSIARTPQLLGWEPTGPRLIADMDGPEYFTGVVAARV